MSNYKVDITGLNTSKIKSLTHKQNIELFRKMHDGDKEAKDKLVSGNLKLVLSILKRFNKRNVNLDDLFQVGVVGLIKAIDNFDVSYNLKLSTYGVPLIVGEIKKYLRDNNTPIRVSRSTKDVAYQILRFKEDYINMHGREPSSSEIASFLNISEYEVGYALDSLKEPMSISEPILNTDKDMMISLHRAFGKISTRERSILIDRFVIGKTQSEIAEKLSISQAQVSRIEKNALSKLRKLIK